jgi:heme-degrading monooxygenase HmoA
MIRVIYNFEVKAGHENDFIEAWKRVTRTIRTTARGAKGSLLTRDVREREQFIAVGRWESVADFQRFQNVGLAGSEAQKALEAALNGRVGIQVVEEINDLTVYDEQK